MGILLAIVLAYAIIITFKYFYKTKDEPKSYEISNEELKQIVNKFYNTDTDFENFDLCQLVEDYFNGKAIPRNTNDTGYVEAVAECVGNECPASPAREDCCSSKDGKCHLVININKLCGIEEAVKDPSMITEKEAKLLAEALSKYFEA